MAAAVSGSGSLVPEFLAEGRACSILDLSLAMMLVLAMDVLVMVITYLDAHCL